MDGSKEQFLRQFEEHGAWLAQQLGVVAFHPQMQPGETLIVTGRNIPEATRQAIRERFGAANVVFHEGTAFLHH